jgi:hypothetical protein
MVACDCLAALESIGAMLPILDLTCCNKTKADVLPDCDVLRLRIRKRAVM